MKLINDFFQIEKEERKEGEYRCQVSLNPEHGIYQAHFPGNPVTPGVCLVQMATEILEQEYQQKLLFSTAGSIKFKNPVGPNEHPTFVFTKVKTEDGQLKANVSIENADTQFAKMSFVLKVV